MTLQQLSRLRQGVYRLAGAGFSYPTAEMVNAAAGARPLFEDLGLFDYAFAPEVAEAIGELAASDLDELGVAYVALFEAGVGGASCPPHESAHRSNSRNGEVADLQSRLKRTIMQFGLRLDPGHRDMVDHVSTEMHVMTMLCRWEAERHAASSPYGMVASSQLRFLNDHILAWVPEFTAMVQTRCRHAAYTALAAAVQSFLAHERQILPLLVDMAEDRR